VFDVASRGAAAIRAEHKPRHRHELGTLPAVAALAASHALNIDFILGLQFCVGGVRGLQQAQAEEGHRSVAYPIGGHYQIVIS